MTTQSERTQLALIQQDITYMKQQLNSVDTKVSQNYVTKEESTNILRRVKLLEKIVYGAIALILIAVGGAVVSTVITK